MLKNQLHIFSPISLNEMDAVSLLKRVDTKFIISKEQLINLLSDISNDFKILEIDGNRLMTYNSIYFDTPDYDFYLAHHNKRSKRTKIRVRKYIESNLTFLEIKQKNNKGVLNKSRIKIDDLEDSLSKKSLAFIHKKTKQKTKLTRSISNSFNRLTLVNKNMKERVTIDLNLAFNNIDYNPNLVIIELKQEKFDRTSKIVKLLKNIKITPFGISKYCIGLANHYPDLKQNLFKQKILTINKI